MEIKNLVKTYENQIIENLTTLVSYPSVLDTSDAKYPFGKANADCLEAALNLCEQYGFKTKNLDNYCGYAEIGEGEELIGVIGHLDVVPVSDGWKTDPFTLTRDGNKLYGRGSSDDKGPVCCSMAALQIVKQLRPNLNKRIRLIMGCNEETGSKCLDYYVKKEGHVDWGFTPDGSFPGVHGEKGMVGGTFTCVSNVITNMYSGIAGNIVPNKVTLDLLADSYNKELLEKYYIDNNIQYELENNHLTVYGQSAHASTPEEGVNAVNKAILGLYHAECKDPFVEFYYNTFAQSTDGAGLGINFTDAYGALTLNIGVIRQEGNQITGSIDIRFPVTMHSEDITKPMLENCKGATLNLARGVEPLFFAPDSTLIKTLVDAYVTVTGDTVNKPITMGGGTYAKGIKNTIAFGGMFPDAENAHMHDNDEFAKIDELLMQTEIYVHALLKLLDI